PQQGSRGNGSACGGRLAPRLRQGPANSKSLCRPCNAIGWFGTRQKPLRSIDRSPRRFDLFAQLQNLAAGGLDPCPRLGHEVAMLGVHRACSRGFERPNETTTDEWVFWFLGSGKNHPLSPRPREGHPATRASRGPRCISMNQSGLTPVNLTTLPHWLERRGRKNPYHRRRLLRAHRERPRSRRAAKESDERAALHSITSSALTMTIGECREEHHVEGRAR